jgi:predicted O-linked N-acetylglucosamine transferase (SPINDLY family)
LSELLKPVMALVQTDNREGALAACATVAQQNPADADVASFHAYLLLSAARIDEAIAEARRAVMLRPDSAPMRANLARAMMSRAPLEEVLREIDAAKALAPQWADLYASESEACTNGGFYMEAVRRGRNAAALFPTAVPVLLDLAIALHTCGDSHEALQVIESAIKRSPTDLALISSAASFTTYADALTPEQVFDAHRRYGRVLARHYPASDPVPTAPPLKGRRVRVGLISPDLREHSVAFFTRPLLQHYDRDKLELFVYQTSHGDALTDELSALPDYWKRVHGRDRASLFNALRADHLDLLIELSGHTRGHVLPVLHRRVAVRQATYLGYANTTGVPAMQFRIIDSFTDPVGSEKLASEHLIRIDPCFLCYTPPADSPPPAAPPSQRAGHITFGSFNTVKKISETTVRLWSSVLSRVPNSRLLLKSNGFDEPALREHLRQRFEAVGIAPDRIDLLGLVRATGGHLATYHQVDIALDTFPYHGTTTTCEALWMGVPVVTLAGDRHASRVGVSLLTNVGLPDLITTTPDQFTQVASTLAADPERLAHLRTNLRTMVENSPLCDGPAFARRFEAAVAEMTNS